MKLLYPRDILFILLDYGIDFGDYSSLEADEYKELNRALEGDVQYKNNEIIIFLDHV